MSESSSSQLSSAASGIPTSARVRPESEERQEAFVHHLATDGRVVIEIVPDARIGFDAEEMFRSSPAGPSRTEV